METYDTSMVVYRGNALVGSRLKQLRCDNLFDSQDNAVLAADTNRRAAVLYSLDGVLDLEVASIWREDGVEQVVTRSYRGLDVCDSAVSLLDSVAGVLTKGRRLPWFTPN